MPQSSDQFFAGDELARILQKHAQDLEWLVLQGDSVSVAAKLGSLQVEDVVAEVYALRGAGRGSHRTGLPGESVGILAPRAGEGYGRVSFRRLQLFSRSARTACIWMEMRSAVTQLHQWLSGMSDRCQVHVMRVPLRIFQTDATFLPPVAVSLLQEKRADKKRRASTEKFSDAVPGGRYEVAIVECFGHRDFDDGVKRLGGNAVYALWAAGERNSEECGVCSESAGD